MKKVKIFVPGRICIFGEHSDLASTYKKYNKKICNGYAIVSCINQGIYAYASYSNKFILKENDKKLNIEMKYELLEKYIKNNSYYCYVCSVAKYFLLNYHVDGINIFIYKNTLPIKKGLSSSASISVLVTKAFNEIYNLNLSTDTIMEIAYKCERETGSLCGRLDQFVAFKRGSFFVEFYNNSINYKKLKFSNNIYFVIADLNGVKNTKKILSSINSAFPYAKDKISNNVINYLGEINKKIVCDSIKYLESGNSYKIGNLMNKAQTLFDKNVMPICYEELKSIKLHSVLNDINIKKMTYGGKGVGSQGDGSVQLIAKNYNCQKKLYHYLKNNLNLNPYYFTIKANKKAIISSK